MSPRGFRQRPGSLRPHFRLFILLIDSGNVTDDLWLGVLEVLSGGSGFVRRKSAGYSPSSDDVYVSGKLVSKFGLRTGDELWGVVGGRPRDGKAPPLSRLDLVNSRPPEEARDRPQFERLGALHPDEQFVLECDIRMRGDPDYTNRVIDLFCPMGRGQRALIVAPSKAGKTTVLQRVAEGIVRNYPEVKLYILLVDERPEEITEMEICGFGEVIASSFDNPSERHTALAEITLERARRRVELGEDVVIILDSITRLARAYNTVEEGSGRTMSGGLDSTALEKPKRFLGSARRIDPSRGGSLTIVATALVDTGSRMDQVIFEEFKGTGNSELLLSREIADKRIFPAIDIVGSATRREELLLSPEALAISRALRRQFAGKQPADAMNELLHVMRKTKTNADLLELTRARV
ncbi:MAG: transcription termination factor Rho [Gemmatimonadetes bacterium]|nr:transcription termination factor Rho [Gemmatimonadota bacterium]